MARTRSAERAEFLNNIVITAAEGGVQSWVDYISEYKKVDRGDGIEHYSFVAHYDDPSEDKKRAQRVDEDLVSRGLNKWLKDPDARADDKRRLREASKENDAGDIDAGDASGIVEYGIWGEIVFA
tara:strand:- start:251 stop:625 length:375 start_codon:yes stop_codon:yes gene_type:complete